MSDFKENIFFYRARVSHLESGPCRHLNLQSLVQGLSLGGSRYCPPPWCPTTGREIQRGWAITGSWEAMLVLTPALGLEQRMLIARLPPPTHSHWAIIQGCNIQDSFGILNRSQIWTNPGSGTQLGKWPGQVTQPSHTSISYSVKWRR